jgi:hypothetical protein
MLNDEKKRNELRQSRKKSNVKKEGRSRIRAAKIRKNE